MAAAMVVLVVTTIATAWFTMGCVSPDRPAAQRLTGSPAEQNLNTPSQDPNRESPRAEAKPIQARAAGQSKEKPKPAPRLAAPAAVLPAPLRNLDVDEALVIPIPRAGEAPVFSATDQGVTPPVRVPPRLNTPRQQAQGAEDLSSIDLIISDRGEVESVKLVSPVRDYREAMMLSAVKAWRFTPASIDGLRVRYQLRIHISVSSVATGNR